MCSSDLGKKVTSEDLTRGLRADGVGTILGGIFNTFPYTSFSQNVGLVGVTGVRSRWVAIAGGVEHMGSHPMEFPAKANPAMLEKGLLTPESLQMGFTAYAQFGLPQVAESFQHLGFPAYFRLELAFAKLIGIALLLAPDPPRMQEWAYAGFAITLIFFAAQLAATLIGLNAGFGFAATVDPFFDGGTGVIERFFSAFTMLVFVQFNGHHLFLAGLRDLFTLMPVGRVTLQLTQIDRLTDLFAGVFVAGVKMALPVLAALLLADLAMGILARVAPQFNLLAVGMPAKLLVGMAAMLVALPIILPRLTAV